MRARTGRVALPGLLRLPRRGAWCRAGTGIPPRGEQQDEQHQAGRRAAPGHGPVVSGRTINRNGAEWEETGARFLRQAGFTGAERHHAGHRLGDIGGVTDWTLEFKGVAPGKGGTCPACQQPLGRFNLAKAMDQLAGERAAAGTPYAAVVRKRAAAPAGRAYFIMEFSLAAGIMRRLDEEGGL
jgi:hypothetical protein